MLMIQKLDDKLIKIIKDGENVYTEFKEANNKLPKNLFETVCAFLNRNGGNIFLGISDNRNIIGIEKEKVDSLKKDFINLCNNPQKNRTNCIFKH